MKILLSCLSFREFTGSELYFYELSSAFQKAGCMEAGDPGCGGNFKVKKKGTVVSRALKKAGRFISSEVKDLKSDIRRRKVKRKRTKIQKSAKTGSYGNPRYLTKGHPNPKGL